VWDAGGWDAWFCPVGTVIAVVPQVIGGDIVSDPTSPDYWSDGYRFKPDFDVMGEELLPVLRAGHLVPLAGVGWRLRAVEWLTRWPRRLWWRSSGMR